MKCSIDRVSTFICEDQRFALPRKWHRLQKQQHKTKLIEFRNPCSMGKVVVLSAVVLTAYVAHQFVFLFHANTSH